MHFGRFSHLFPVVLTNHLQALLIVFLAAILVPLTCSAQSTTAGVRGTVTDATGAVIPGVDVEVVNADTGFTVKVVTDDAGRYTFTLLPIGAYRLIVQKPGFKKYEQAGIRLAANQVAGINPVLEIGAVTQTAEVTAVAPLVNTQTTEVSTLIESRQIRELPLNGRNVIQLATLTNGVSFSQIETVVRTQQNAGGNRLAVNGNQVTAVQFNMDGADAGDPRYNVALNFPNPDAVEEFRFVTSNYSAEFGKNAGGVVNVITKSGTNEIHGSLWEFNRNSAFAARDFFLAKKAPLNQNQFGVSVGGPAIKDKLFWFGNVQWLRIRDQRVTSSAFPPTAAERQGDFSATSRPVLDPLSRVPFAGNIIPRDRIDSVAAKYIPVLPLPNSADGRYVSSVAEPTNDRQFTLKMDYQMGLKSRLSGMYFQTDTEANSAISFNGNDMPYTGDLSQFSPSIRVYQKNFILNHTYTARSNLINNARFSFQRIYWPNEALGHPTILDLGGYVPTTTFGLPDDPITRPGGPPQTSASGRFTQTRGTLWRLSSDKIGISDSVNYISGAHQFKFGFEVQDLDMLHLSGFQSDGQFDGTGTVSGSSLADFMLGTVSVFWTSPADHSHRERQYAGYFEDNIKASKNLTLTLGLRYQVIPPWVAPDHRPLEGGGFGKSVASFIEGHAPSQLFPKAPQGFVYPPSSGFAGDSGVPEGLTTTDWKNFAPRLGLAWDVFGNGKMSVRAAWGIFYANTFGQVTDNYAQNPPWLFQVRFPEVPNGFTNGFSAQLKNYFPIKFSPALDFSPFFPLTAYGPTQQVRNPMIQQFNLSIQYQFAGDLVVNAAYVGNVSQHGLLIRNLNPPRFIPGTGADGQPLSRFNNPNPRRRLNQPFLPVVPYGDVNLIDPINNSAYHSIQLQVRKSFSRGLTFLSSYTFSKTIDFCSNGGNGTNGTIGCSIQNHNRIDLERALAGIHQAQKWTTSFEYYTPSLSQHLGSRNAFVRHVFDDWQLSGIATFADGLPINLSSGQNYSLQGGSDRPNLIGNPYFSGDRSRGEMLQQYFNTAAFVPNDLGTFGNFGRNVLIGPGIISIDTAVNKNFVLAERKKLQLRFEFFNMPNRPNFAAPVTNLFAAARGRILATSTPGRIVQMGAKVTF